MHLYTVYTHYKDIYELQSCSYLPAYIFVNVMMAALAHEQSLFKY